MRTSREARREATWLWRLCRVSGRVDPQRARVIVDRLIEAGGARATVLLAHLLRLLRLEEEKWSARVESAAPLEPGGRAALEEELARRYGRAIETAFAVEPALIGGMRVTVGSDVYDGSIRARLDALAAGF
jgi:F-type H+-transporting ATPase subunit delta